MQTPNEKLEFNRRKKEKTSLKIVNKSNNITPMSFNNNSFFNNSNPFKNEKLNIFSFTPLGENSNNTNGLKKGKTLK